MNFLDILNFILALVFFISLLFNMFMFYYISRKHMKVLDNIVYHREFTDDNYILITMRIVEYLVILFVKRNREQLPEDVQEKIVALDSKFRRPFLILIWNVIVIFSDYFFSIYLENFIR